MEGSRDDEEGGGIHCSYQIAQKPPALKESQVPKLENGTSWLEASLGFRKEGRRRKTHISSRLDVFTQPAT